MNLATTELSPPASKRPGLRSAHAMSQDDDSHLLRPTEEAARQQCARKYTVRRIGKATAPISLHHQSTCDVWILFLFTVQCTPTRSSCDDLEINEPRKAAPGQWTRRWSVFLVCQFQLWTSKFLFSADVQLSPGAVGRMRMAVLYWESFH